MTTKSSFKQLREEEREIRKKLIMEAALSLFDVKPFHDIGMRDIADKAGISPASIYRYFPTRDDLFAEVLSQDISEIESLIQSKQQEGNANYESLIRGIIDYTMTNDAKFQMMCHCMIGQGINQRVLSGYRDIESYLLTLFEKAFRDAGVRENVPFRVQAVLCSLIGIIMVFKNYPGMTDKEKKDHMFKVAMATRYPDGKGPES